MAMTYQNFASLGVNLNRQKYGPLDISNVFTSEADLKYYLTKGTFTTGVSEYWYKSATEKVVPYPYEGQVLATVIDGVVNVYALSLDAEGNFQTQEIGAKVEVDGKTIKLNADGKLELVGIPADIAGKTLVPSLVNGELTWAEPDTSTAEGQQQAIDGLAARATALEAAVNGTGEGDEHVAGLVEKVAALEAVDNATQAELDAYKEVVTAAIAAGVAEAKKYADDNDADTVYDDTALAARVKALEDEERYDDTEVRELIADLDEAIGDAEGGLVKDIADNKQAIADEKARAEAAEKALGERIDGIDFIDQDELDAALEPINTALDTKAAQTDLEALQARVEAFLDNTGAATEAIDTLQELIIYINTHDDNDISGILASIQAIEKKLVGIDSTVAAYVTAAIDALKIGDYAKAADLTALAGRVEVLEAKPFDTYATKTEVEGVDAKFADYTKTSDLNTALGGKVNTSDFETFKGENTTAIGAAKEAAIAAAKTETETQVGVLEDAVAETYATKTELGETVEEIENELLVYAKSADVNAELAKKIETATIAHAVAADPDNGIEAIPEGVTKEGTTLKIVVDAPTRAETTQMIADKVAAVTGGESAAAVKLLVEAEIERSTAKDEAHDTALAKLNGESTVVGSVAEAKALAQKGVDDAAKVAGDLANANTNIGNNTREIGIVKGTITTVNETLSGKITALENKDIELAGLITGLDTAVKGNATTIGEHTAAITALQAKDNELVGLINTLSTDKADKTALETLAGNVYTKTEVDNLFKNFDQTAITDAIAANKKAIEDEAARAKVAEEANKTLIDTLVGSDANKSVRTIASEEVAKVVDSAPEAFDTLKEIATWIQDDATGAAAMSATIAGHSTILAGFGGEGEPADVKTYVNDQIAAAAYELPVATVNALGGVKSSTAENKVAVAEDGTMEVNSVNANKLVQTEGDELILNGGKA